LTLLPTSYTERMSVKSTAVEAALERVREAERSLTEVQEAERVERAHAPAASAFADTLQEVLGDRPVDLEAARRAALQAASEIVWEDAVGPLLSGPQARELLGGVSRQRLDQLVKARRVIALEESSGDRRFPAWQFHDGRPLEGLGAAHRQLVELGKMDPWTAASWCVSAHPQLGDQSPRDWAAGGGDATRLALVAHRDASRLAR
jgi:hypothetical protein